MPDLTCDSPNCPFEGEPHNRRHWHLDRSFSVQSLLQAFVVLGLVYGYLQTIEHRISVVEQAHKDQPSKDAAQDAELRQIRQEIRDDLKEIRQMLEDRARR